MKRFSLLLIALVALGLLAACHNDTPPASDAQLQTIVITEPVRAHQWAPVHLAETLGFFAEEGLHAEFQTVSGTDSSLPVFSGDAQFGLRGIEMALMANEAGRGCKVLVSTTSRYPYQFIGADQRYDTVESLRGQTIAGGQGPTSAPHAFSKAILLHAGIIPDEETSVVSMLSSGYAAAIRAGEVQAVVGTNPWVVKTLLEHDGVLILDGRDPAVMETLFGSSTYELFVLFASDNYIAAEPETVQKTVNAVARAIQWMNNATAEEITEALGPLWAGDPAELLYSVEADQSAGLYNPDGRHTTSGFQAAMELTTLSGGISKTHTEAEIFDESFLNEAWHALGE